MGDRLTSCMMVGERLHPQHLHLIPVSLQSIRQCTCTSVYVHAWCLLLNIPTWDMFSPADVHHQLSVRQVTQRSQGLDVAVWYCRVWHGINLLWLSDQQVRDDFVICKAAKGNWHDHQTRRKTQRQKVGEFLLRMTTKCSTANVGQKKKGSFAYSPRNMLASTRIAICSCLLKRSKTAAVRVRQKQSCNFHMLISVLLLFVLEVYVLCSGISR